MHKFKPVNRHSVFSFFLVQKRSLRSQVTGKCETLKPGITEILMECYCVASKKPIRYEKTKPQTAMVIVCGFEVSMHVLTFILICQYSFNLHSKINPSA